jgi:hypothetical protein
MLVLSGRTEQRAEQAGVYAGRILKGETDRLAF